MSRDGQRVRVETRGAICTITLDHPPTLNALAAATLSDLRGAVEALGPAVRVVILTGTGKAFAAGADIACMRDMDTEEARAFSQATNDLYGLMRTSDKVFIAAINGYALGGGCELALACDLRIASEWAKFGLPEVSLGILPGGGGTQRLSRLIGTERAAALILTGDRIGAPRALALGLVSQVVPPEELLPAATALAGRVLKNAPLAVAYAKACIRASEEMPLSAGLSCETNFFGLCFANPEQREGMTAFLEKRPPSFEHTRKGGTPCDDAGAEAG